MTPKRATPVERRFGGRAEEEARRELADSIRTVADDAVSGDDGVRLLGTVVDLSDDLADLDGTEAGIRFGTRLLRTENRPDRQAIIHYFLANPCESRRQL